MSGWANPPIQRSCYAHRARTPLCFINCLTKISAYAVKFHGVGTDPICYTIIKGIKQHQVTNTKPVPAL
ncbi:hypothetical protein CICLE_v10029757mg [Citrus x clementina]|uniref:Uncharacterized protein n=2 Tax=Citrus TaxID=2706 RepID=A0A067FQJ9_CITSI|nr:hypothetical protein CICLE_v10029757mg [Citrus x clementina]KDO68440.1 hypothetical protein CISIN_1g035285mg [Citrus sinensis]